MRKEPRDYYGMFIDITNMLNTHYNSTEASVFISDLNDRLQGDTRVSTSSGKIEGFYLAETPGAMRFHAGRVAALLEATSIELSRGMIGLNDDKRSEEEIDRVKDKTLYMVKDARNRLLEDFEVQAKSFSMSALIILKNYSQDDKSLTGLIEQLEKKHDDYLKAKEGNYPDRFHKVSGIINMCKDIKKIKEESYLGDKFLQEMCDNVIIGFSCNVIKDLYKTNKHVKNQMFKDALDNIETCATIIKDNQREKMLAKAKAEITKPLTDMRWGKKVISEKRSGAGYRETIAESAKKMAKIPADRSPFSTPQIVAYKSALEILEPLWGYKGRI